MTDHLRSRSGGVVDGLCAYLDASPSPFHAVDTAAALLGSAGFTEVAETDPTPGDPGRYVVRRGGSLIAWSTAEVTGGHRPSAPYRIVGAHTDSPNLRIKPQPDRSRAGWQTLGVEVYGGALTNSWLDRDLGLSGRVAVRDENAAYGVAQRLWRVDDPVLRVSQLAVHLDRSVRTEGLRLNDQLHLAPHWGLERDTGARTFRGWLAQRVGVRAEDLLGFDAMTHDLTPARRVGVDGDLVASGRLDNLATSYAAVRALLEAVEHPSPRPVVPVIVLFDHEEVGSTSERGAQSTFLPAWLERVVLAAGGTREDYWRALAGTVVASGDMAHATHPNYPERHEPEHQIRVNGGPVLKVNTNLRYATDSPGAAAFALACRQAGVPMQTFVTRSDLPCGSTVGPVTAALTGATTVDFGAPMLSMHSAREVCGALDQAAYAAALAAFLAPA